MVVTRAKRKFSVKALSGRLKADRKKVIIAVVLIGVMVIMWVRVFTKSGPRAAKAAVVSSGGIGQDLTASENVHRGSNVTFTRLPMISGRNDVLSRNFFIVKSWQEFIRSKRENSGDVEETNNLARDNRKFSLRSITAKLTLEAIELGNIPRIFINDNFLGVGDKFFINDGVESIECEVVQIRENKAVIRCGKTEVTLELSDAM